MTDPTPTEADVLITKAEQQVYIKTPGPFVTVQRATLAAIIDNALAAARAEGEAKWRQDYDDAHSALQRACEENERLERELLALVGDDAKPLCPGEGGPVR